jgi:RNA polymerase sigma factor (sigma-70 family)
MSILHPLDPNAPTTFRCAQSGCRICLEYLLRRHEPLVGAVVWAQRCRDVPKADLVQEGRIALWRAILHFDPERGIAFSTFAWIAVQRRIWTFAKRQRRPQGWLTSPPVPDPAAQAATAVHQAAVQAAVGEALRCLSPQLRQVLVASYGLDDQPPRSLADLGRQYGVTRACVWQWRQKALVRLRVPAISGRLRRLCDQDHRQAYRRAQALNIAWRRRWRHGGRR